MSNHHPEVPNSEQSYFELGFQLDHTLLAGMPILIPLDGSVSQDMTRLLKSRRLRPTEVGHAETAIELS